MADVEQGLVDFDRLLPRDAADASSDLLRLVGDALQLPLFVSIDRLASRA